MKFLQVIMRFLEHILYECLGNIVVYGAVFFLSYFEDCNISL